MSRRFLVLHGWQNHRPVSHWQWQLVETLRSQREVVLYPQFPEPDRPSLSAWTELLRAELAQLGRGERVVVAHSLGVTLWLHASRLLTKHERVDRVLLVSPPSPRVLTRYDDVAAFARVHPDPAAVASAANVTRLVHSDGDPYCPEGAGSVFAGVDVDVDLIPGGEHINPDSGYGPWPSAVDWCRDPSTRLAAQCVPG